ncbi:MAG: LTA synthase family protein [Bdellovibrionales bacterium]
MEPGLAKENKITAASFVAILAGCYFVLSNLQRLMYVVWILIANQTFPPRLPQALFKGVLFDLAASFYLFAPLALLFFFLPKRFAQQAWFRALIMTLSLFPLFIVSFSSIGEIFFFDEFHARYNFIAVDYLVYTTEVIRNVLESYNVFLLAAGVILPLLGLGLLVRILIKKLDRGHVHSPLSKIVFSGLAALAIIAAAQVTEDRVIASEDYWPRELSKNSLFTIFSAYNHNSINYHEFYSSMSTELARKVAQKDMGGKFINGTTLTREITAHAAEKRYNVVLVAMESMSASFLAHFGNRQPITPNLDKLADAGLLFTNFYATGTRTVRGLEALMLSLPPTPGQSILRRPNSDGMFNLGTIFADHGYRTQFVYGGYAYFDNMREWFESNAFEVVDRSNFPSNEIQFGNAWGVCDEDLFAQVLKQEEAITKDGKSFFQVVLTTSNHRPYTYPEGKIDMPPHNGREGAIKYSDYSIGKFIEAAQTKPWFKDTIFIFVADHDASVAGGTDIPVKDYLIPAIFFSPGNIAPEKITKLASQIDLGPTLLGLLGFRYESRLFGEDLRTTTPDRAFLGTYQKVARLVPHQLTVLSPGKMVEAQEVDDNYVVKKSTSIVVKDASVLSEPALGTIAIYQSASELFTQGLLKRSAGK